MTKVIIMGSGAAPGVPSVASGWGACNPANDKNRRRRTGTYIEICDQKILIDTSPDIRTQLLDNGISYLDAVLYTHAHADHLHGIDDLRELNRISKRPIDIYGSENTIKQIKTRFSYLICEGDCPDGGFFKASLIPHTFSKDEDLFLGNVKITPLGLSGHTIDSNGYIFNDGEIVYVADCEEIPESELLKIKNKPKLMIMPLTIIKPHHQRFYHMGLDKVLEYVNLIKPEITVLNHMASECDYDVINDLTPANVWPAYDNMTIEI